MLQITTMTRLAINTWLELGGVYVNSSIGKVKMQCKELNILKLENFYFFFFLPY
jgi:hypothetical protein